MKILTEQDIVRVYDSLPEHIQAALNSPQLTNAAKMLGEKHDLHIDQIDSLIQEVAYALAGLTKAEEFIDRLENQVRLSRAVAQDLGKDIDSIIFEAVRDALRDSTNDEYVNEKTESNTDTNQYVIGEGDAIRIKKPGVEVSADHIPEESHHEVRNELIRAIEENDTLSTFVINKTEPITIETQQKPMEYKPSTSSTPSNPLSSSASTPTTEEPHKNDIASLLNQPSRKSRPQSTDPYREPIESVDTKPAFLRKLYSEE